MESLENEGLLTNTTKRNNKSLGNASKQFFPFQICQRKNIFFVLMASPFMVILLVLNGSSGLTFLHHGQVWFFIIWKFKRKIYLNNTRHFGDVLSRNLVKWQDHKLSKF
jgi:hypothetical protein